MDRQRLLYGLAALSSFFLLAGSVPTASGADRGCTLAEKLSGQCPEVSGTVNGDGVDIRGSVNVPGSADSRIRGLDAIRLVCAFWVVMSHNSGIGLSHQHVSGSLLWRVTQVLWSMSFIIFGLGVLR